MVLIGENEKYKQTKVARTKMNRRLKIICGEERFARYPSDLFTRISNSFLIHLVEKK